MNDSSREERFLRDEMRQALDERPPDRTAMLNRIAANRAAGPRPRGRSWRLAGSAAAVATVLGLGGVAQWAMADDSGPAPTPAAPPPATTTSATTAPTTPPTTEPTPSRRPSTAATSRPARPSSAPPPAASPVRGHPGDTQVEKGALWSDGSVVGGGRSAVMIKAAEELTTLTLTLRVEPAAGLTLDGLTTDVPGDLIATEAERDGDALLYHFTLREGRTLAKGRYAFTARYGGAGSSRNAGQDTFEAFADATVGNDNKRLHVYGNFYAG